MRPPFGSPRFAGAGAGGFDGRVVTGFDNEGLRFDVEDVGAGEAVVLLHGFPQDRTAWARVTPPLVAAGLRVLAPDLRGYSPAARPVPRRAYTLDRLAGDVLALLDAAGTERAHLVGHDWGAALAFHCAGSYPDRVHTLTAFSVPHRAAWAPSAWRSTQLLHSAYMGFFQLPWLPERVLARPGMVDRLRRSGLDEERARRYAGRDLSRALNWYRAMLVPGPKRFPRVPVRTRFVWGDEDEFVTAHLARSCGRWVDGEYTFRILRGVGHWIPEMHPRLAAEEILAAVRPR
jgi:pimeloyl-ACP methyl ester carboxylesterase